VTVPDLVLNSGRTIPQLGFGVAHIDTAQRYGNEKEVAEAIRNSGLSRESCFAGTFNVAT